VSDEYEEAGTCRDIDGAAVKVGHTRSVVIVETDSTVAGRGMLHFGPAERDDFMRLYMAAERPAESWALANPEGDEPL